MTKKQDLIPVFSGEINGKPVRLVDARELHAFLEVGRDFSNWIKDRIEKYGFVEGEDYIKFEDLRSPNLASAKSRAVYAIEYHVSLNMGKELAMVENNEKGRTIRRYFIAMEEQALLGMGRGSLSVPKLIATQNQMLRLIKELKRETAPAIRAALHANLESTCRLLNVPVPPLADIGRELLPELVPPLVAEFWELYEFLGGAAVLNHSSDPKLIAIHLTHFGQVAAERKVKILPLSEYRKVLRASENPRFVDTKPVHSALNAQHNRTAPGADQRPATLRCWLFETVEG